MTQDGLAPDEPVVPANVEYDERIRGARREMATTLRGYADNPCALGYVPIFPKTLRQIAHLLDGNLSAAIALTRPAPPETKR